MKSFFILALSLLILSTSCSKDDDDPFKDYKFNNRDGLTSLNGCGIISKRKEKTADDINFIYEVIYGLKDSKMWVGFFDFETKEQVYEWQDAYSGESGHAVRVKADTYSQLKFCIN